MPKHCYRVLETIRWNEYLVPFGYITDGASVPRVFWSAIPPNDSNSLPAVIFHDYYCSIKKFDLADRVFLEIMRDVLELTPLRYKTMYYGVRFYTIFIRAESSVWGRIKRRIFNAK